MSASQGYQLVRRIGSGASGAVYLAKTNTGELAIRQFESKADPGGSSWHSDRVAFLEAGRRMHDVRSPRIVPVLEVIDEAGEAFVVMPYMAAPTLASALVGGRRFTPEETGSIVEHIATALDYAHGRGVVHGDLKPSDVFLTPSGAMLSDFAISPRASGSVPSKLVHPYLSPEHVRAGQAIGPRSDQYSLAVITYQMYTGRLPYGDNTTDLAQAILNAPVTPPSQVNPQLPASIDPILLKALNRDPSPRYGSCRELVGLLGATLIGRGEIERRRIPKLVYLLAPALLLLLLALMWFSRKKPVETIAQAPPVPAAQTAAPNPTPTAAAAPPRKSAKASGTASGKTLERRASSENSAVAAPPPVRPAPVSARIPAAEPEGTQMAGATMNPTFSIDVLSRGTHKVENGSSFPLLDPQLGELGQGDLAALVSFQGQRPPRGGLRVEWILDGLVADSKPVVLKPGAGQIMVAYGNEPSAGTYRINLKLKDRTIQSFTFRITQ